MLIRAEHSVVSAGTELTFLRGEFESGSRWSSWVDYPHRPGYSAVGVVVEAGAEVTGCKPRVTTRGGHGEYTLWPETVPAEVVTRRCPPEEATLVYRDLLARRSDELGIVIDWTA